MGVDEIANAYHGKEDHKEQGEDVMEEAALGETTGSKI
jgi:hypothetical protein